MIEATNINEGEAVFHVDHISKVYQMGDVAVHALRGVDLDLYAGELVVLLGASGSGKSTLLNILGGLDVPTSGHVQYLHHTLTTASETELTEFRREHVGFVFQFYNLIPSLTALENVSLVTEIAEDPMDPVDALGLVGLQQRMHHFPAQLSGGEQQRVAIARALINNPALVLADEPTGNLDPQIADETMRVFLKIRERGTTLIVASHDVELIKRYGTRIIFLRRGRLADDLERVTKAGKRA